MALGARLSDGIRSELLSRGRPMELKSDGPELYTKHNLY